MAIKLFSGIIEIKTFLIQFFICAHCQINGINNIEQFRSNH